MKLKFSVTAFAVSSEFRLLSNKYIFNRLRLERNVNLRQILYVLSLIYNGEKYLEFDIVVIIYFRTRTFELLNNPLQKQKINNKIMACVRNVCLYGAARCYVITE